MPCCHLPRLLSRASFMLPHSKNLAVAWIALAAIAVTSVVARETQAQDPPAPAADSLEFYSAHIQPLLVEHCYSCHSHDSGESNGLLLVDSGAAMKAGGTRGAAVVPGNLDSSLLYRAMLYTDPDLQMPPSEKLPDEQIEKVKQWIEAGAVAPEASPGAASTTAPTVASNPQDHWAYRMPQPAAAATAGENAIDTLLQRRLNEAGLDFSPPADRRTLLRRLAYDLTGLSPTFDELENFANDPRDQTTVVHEAIDRFLASDQFGERWARHWMDVARYSDTKGYVFQEDRQYAEAYRYRDWLIQSFNQDMPFTTFVRKQIAADLDVTPEGQGNEHLPALGFLTLGRRFLNNSNDIIDDRLDVITRGLMGMTLACARCHDHKFDPVSQADYYSLAGVFLNTIEPGGEPFAHRLADSPEQRPARILIRGNPGRPGDEVPRRFVSFLDREQQPFGAGSGRAELADHITGDNNPLTARVMVNRIWMVLMGSSLVESPSDLGMRCPPPLHQDLLDQMAIEFQQDQWSMKQAIRRIVSSRAYQQQSASLGNTSSPGQEQAAIKDPTNTLYWRMNRRRRDIESLRDGLLAASGQLDRQLNGPSIKLDQKPFSKRRTIYAYIDRQDLAGFLRNFDMASPDAHSPVRAYTSVPQQGLYLLNSDFVAEQATVLGDRAAAIAAQQNRGEAIAWLVREVLGRTAEEHEKVLMEQFLSEPLQTPESLVERWICGYGSLSENTEKLLAFERLPRFHEGRWAGNDGAPDSTLGWCLLNANGGHPGTGMERVVVRRWIAPRDGRVRIRGSLNHRAEQGDGVRGSVLLAGEQRLGQWTVKTSEQKTIVEPFQVLAGQTIDFVTDCVTEPGHDSFQWTVHVRYQDGARESYDSEKQFPIPAAPALNEWHLLSQALLASNEFAFVD